MTEHEAIDIAKRHVFSNGIEAGEIETVRFVDVSQYPSPYQSQGSFWAVIFAEPNNESAISNNGIVLNICDDTGIVTQI